MEVWENPIGSRSVNVERPKSPQPGHPSPAPTTWEQLIAEVHPDDREAVITAVHGAAPGDAPLTSRFRMKRDGGWRWMEQIGGLSYDEAGQRGELRFGDHRRTRPSAIAKRTVSVRQRRNLPQRTQRVRSRYSVATSNVISSQPAGRQAGPPRAGAPVRVRYSGHISPSVFSVLSVSSVVFLSLPVGCGDSSQRKSPACPPALSVPKPRKTWHY